MEVKLLSIIELEQIKNILNTLAENIQEKEIPRAQMESSIKVLQVIFNER